MFNKNKIIAVRITDEFYQQLIERNLQSKKKCQRVSETY